MRKIGLIGGMSFESTAVYYRLINEAVRKQLGGHHSSQILLHSVDFQTIVDLQKAGQWEDAGKLLAEIAAGLEAAGAECIVICTVTMHLVADMVEAAIRVPLIHVIDGTARQLKATGFRKPLLLATRYTMENGFYQARMKRHDIEVLVPDESGRAATHSIIFDELCAGKVLEPSRETLFALIKKAKAEGADSVILGCTEICMILNPAALPLPGFDSTRIHIEEAVEFSIPRKT